LCGHWRHCGNLPGIGDVSEKKLGVMI
jgi:hypothetical protein